MPWEASNYQVEVDANTDEIVIRTLNKKYFKRFCISDLKRAGIKLEARLLDIEYANNTLVVSYSKPEEILKEERKIYQEIIRIKQEIKENPNKKYDPGCNQQ